MRKFIMFFMSVMMIISLAACTPTQPKREAAVPETQVPASTGGASDKVPDPNAEPMEVISVYSKNQDGTGLTQAMDAVDQLTAQAIVDKLIEYGVLDEGTEVLTFDMKDGIGTLDLSQVPSGDSTGDAFILTSVGNTFIENFELEKLKFLVNGENYSGDDYLEYIKDYDKLK